MSLTREKALKYWENYQHDLSQKKVKEDTRKGLLGMMIVFIIVFTVLGFYFLLSTFAFRDQLHFKFLPGPMEDKDYGMTWFFTFLALAFLIGTVGGISVGGIHENNNNLRQYYIDLDMSYDLNMIDVVEEQYPDIVKK